MLSYFTYCSLAHIFSPLMIAVGLLFSGFFYNRNAAIQLAIKAMTCCFIYSVGGVFFNVGSGVSGYLVYNFCFWFNCGYLNVFWGFLFDSVTYIMFLVVSCISWLVHWYSKEYMQNDPYIIRFTAYLSLFTFFMYILISANNLFQLFLGWEGVGLCSFLLISFWHTRVVVNRAALKALIMNRIGDIGLLIGISIIYLMFKTVDYGTIFMLAPYYYNYVILCFNVEWDMLTIAG